MNNVFAEVSFHTEALKVEDDTQFLLGLGAITVCQNPVSSEILIDKLDGKPVCWQLSKLTAAFVFDKNLAAINESLTEYFKPWHTNICLLDVNLGKIYPNELQSIAPIRINHNLQIVSQACDADIPSVIISSTLAFGTGLAAATNLCLRWLSKQSLSESRVLDYGCGTGILGLAAAKLGAKYCVLTDCDEKALQSCQSNMLANRVDDNKIRLVRLDELQPNADFDVILANIELDILLILLPDFIQQLKPGGTLLVSGLLKQQQAQFIAKYSFHFENFEIFEQDEWIAIMAINIPPP